MLSIEKSKTIFDKALELMREVSKIVEYNNNAQKSIVSVWQPQNWKIWSLKDIFAIAIKI